MGAQACSVPAGRCIGTSFVPSLYLTSSTSSYNTSAMAWWGGGGKDKGKGKGKGYGTFKVDESGGVLGDFVGTIKSFSGFKGYGFIESADIQAMGHKDVW